MKKIFLLVLCFCFIKSYAQYSWNNRHSFFQPNSVSAVFIADGVLNLDRYFTFSGLEAGFIWPVNAPLRLTALFGTGFWIGAKVGPQRELRVAAAVFNSHYSPGNIPVIGQVPPLSECNDTSWKVYLVNLNDQSLVIGGSRTKVAGGTTYNFSYVSWANWPVEKGAPYAEINNIPGYQPGWNGDRPGIGNGSKSRPEEICFMVYMDYKNCTNAIHISESGHPGGTLPIGVEIHQLIFAFACPLLNNIYFSKLKFINKSLLSWDSTYITTFSDADVGNAFDDATGIDTLRSLAFVYNKDNLDVNYGTNPPATGTTLLQGPVKFTGNNNDTAKLPYDTLIGFRMVMNSGFTVFRGGGDVCEGDPDFAVPGYNFMRGMDGCGHPIMNWVTGQHTTFRYSGNACTQTGWIDSTMQDRRYMQNTGPFYMSSGDTQIIVEAYLISREGGNNFLNVCALQSLSDSALKYYYNDFRTCIPIGIRPISSEVPDRFALYQNYPNPFNPTTKLRFDIPSLVRKGAGVVVFKIYDILGREIETLVNEQLQPGTYEVEWNAENFPSGVYFYQLTSSGFTQTNKMVLLK